eukprot:COSAG01_NODE_1636_length_9660_cov_10.575881_5_plen_109_part_00
MTWRPLTHGYAAFGELAQLTPTLLPVTVTEGVAHQEEAGYMMLVGRGASGQIRGLDQNIDAAHALQPGVIMGGVQTVQRGFLVVDLAACTCSCVAARGSSHFLAGGFS